MYGREDSTMNGKKLILGTLVLSLAFNAIFVIAEGLTMPGSSGWMFPDLGPAVIQDSSYDRAPALESPIEMIGDLPGLYPIYQGNPLQQVNETHILHGNGLDMLPLAAVFGFVPFLILFILGRRSYGISKTQ